MRLQLFLRSHPLNSVSAYHLDELAHLDATETAELVRNRGISALEAVDAAIDRLEVIDAQLHALVCRRFDAARAEARTVVKDRPAAFFAGVPSLLKDNTNIAGLPTRHGSRATPATPVQANEAFTDQLLATGLIPLAKTTMPEFGLTATTEFTQSDASRNPWNSGHSTGGSSGGSAALVAAGVVPIAHANDGGGSIRIPAACCGVIGLKPSRARVANPLGAEDLPLNILANGVVTRSVRDTAHFMADAERFHQNPSLPPLGFIEGPATKRRKIAMYTTRHDGSVTHPDCVAAVKHTAQMLEKLGHSVEEVDSPIDPQLADDFLLYWAMLAAAIRHFGGKVIAPGFNSSELEPLTYQLAKHFRGNIFRFPSALRRLRHGAMAYAESFRDFDVFLSPTLGTPPPLIGHLALDLEWEQARDRLFEFACFTAPQNVTGAPAMSLPMGMSSDRGDGAAPVPVGVQIAAPFAEERRLIEIAYELEAEANWAMPGCSDITAAGRGALRSAG